MSNDPRDWAQQTADAITAGKFEGMGVTYSGDGEYTSSQDILQPLSAQLSAPPPAPLSATVTGADIIAKARSYIGKFSDGPDVPVLAHDIAAVFPDLAAYCANAGPGTAWCGIFVAKVMSDFGIRPPHADDSVGGFMYVDAWQSWGSFVDPSAAQPGDVAIFLGSPHHVTFVAGNGKYCGGNQGAAGVVSEERIRTPNHVRRAPAVATAALATVPVKPSAQFEKCLAYVLHDEGGNDDDPRDPGGRTSRGITASEWAIWTSTHPGLPSDVWQAPQASVAAIYRQSYWDVVQGDKLPAGVDYAVFDYGVNSGNSRSAKALQAIVGADVDGEIGPDTIAATLAHGNPAAIVTALCNQRLAFLQGLSTWGTFGRGWSTRVSGVRANGLAMAGATAQQAALPTPIPPPAPAIPLPPSDPVIPHIIARIDAIAAQLAALRAQQEPPPMADPVQTVTPVATAPPQLDVSSIIDKAVKAAMTAQKVSSSPTWAALKAAIPGGSVYLSIAAFVALWVVQSHGLVGTGLPGASTATPTGGTLTALLSGGGIAGLFASFRQLLTPKAKA